MLASLSYTSTGGLFAPLRHAKNPFGLQQNSLFAVASLSVWDLAAVSFCEKRASVRAGSQGSCSPSCAHCLLIGSNMRLA